MMETAKTNFGKVSGVIVMICAIGLTILNIFFNKNFDSYIMPFILLMAGIIFLVRVQSEESRQITVSPKKQKILIATLSISLVAGIVTLIITLI